MKRMCLFVLIISLPSFAGFKKGNGGNVIVCLETNQLLDFYEGGIIYNYHYNRDADIRDWKVILNEKISLLTSESAQRISLYKAWLSTFEQESLLLSNVDLGTINDSLHVVIPVGCSVKQTVNQQSNPLPSEKRYWISKSIWDKLSNFDKAGLVFHELTYRYLKENDSRNTREFTALTFSNEFKDE